MRRKPISRPQPQLLYTPAAIAAALQASEEYIRRAIRQGRIKAVKLGRFWRVSSVELNNITARGIAPEVAR